MVQSNPIAVNRGVGKVCWGGQLSTGCCRSAGVVGGKVGWWLAEYIGWGNKWVRDRRKPLVRLTWGRALAVGRGNRRSSRGMRMDW